MPNWHYNGCFHWNLLLAVHWTYLSRAQFEFLCDSVAVVVPSSLSHSLSPSFSSVSPSPGTKRHRNRKLCSHFAIYPLWLCPAPWLNEVIVIIIAHTSKTLLINTNAVHLVWILNERARSCLPLVFFLHFCFTRVKNKFNLLLPICRKNRQKRKIRKIKRKKKKRGKTSRKLHNRSACVINVMKIKKKLSIIIWKKY